MPKKHRTSLKYPKPENSPHHTLASSRANNNGRFQSIGTRVPQASAETSVNALIDHLRRTQVQPSSENLSSAFHRSSAPQSSVPPALRDILELPDPSQPDPRPNRSQTPIGVRPVRRVPGPPPPRSWTTRSTSGSQDGSINDEPDMETPAHKQTHHLDRLPGAIFPKQPSLQHTVMVQMAKHWHSQVEYDGMFLSQLPNHIKVAMLSYVAKFGSEESLGSTKGLTLLFPTETEYAAFEAAQSVNDSINSHCHDGIERLDLGLAIGNGLTFKKLRKILQIYAIAPTSTSSESAAPDYVPDSWDETETEAEESSIPQFMPQPHRFNNLKYISFAHPIKAAANWTDLVDLLPNLPKITHLSLAYWPFPTWHPVKMMPDEIKRSDAATYEAAAIIRRLSRSTLRLKWLDLQGCTDWLRLLSTWTEHHPGLGDDVVYGPEWNTSWRNVVSLNLTPGCKPETPNALAKYVSGAVIPISLEPIFREFQWAVSKYHYAVTRAVSVQQSVRRYRVKHRGSAVHVETGGKELYRLQAILRSIRLPPPRYR
ncbi:hypothetical protein N7466_007572 [Penicillium verhagenii]|uniref:uncharacterized protein n=1 Tax=Penicillium verhagenii TaxID=1562060 RepID=UPI002544D616|nr:uncharacterized protein N7466_007572 [Penicillium verhagenii]KAJ5928616.1 hypothetical protein N7466_007572 [Penicillium verhagenii]